MLNKDSIPSVLIFPEERLKPEVIKPEKLPAYQNTLRFLSRLINLLLGLFFLHCFHRNPKKRQAELIADFFRSVGALWLSLGRILSLRSDILSAELAGELEKIRDNGKAMPFEIIEVLLNTSLHRDYSTIFDFFDPYPFVSSAVTQTHRAHLKYEDAWVAVKILHPNAEQAYINDSHLINWFIYFLSLFRISPNMRWKELVYELNAVKERDLDLRFEAASLSSLKKNLKDHDIYIPELFNKYSEKNILVMEFISGALMSDFIRLKVEDPERLGNWLIDNNINSRKIAKTLFHSVYRQIFEDNYFHSEMHPSDIILLRDSKVAIINCQNIGWLEKDRLSKLKMCIEACAFCEHSTAADIYFLLASKLPVVDLSEVKFQFIRAFKIWHTRSYIENLPYHEKSISWVLAELNNIVYRYSFATEWSTSKLVRTWFNLDSSLASLEPSINYMVWLRNYFNKASRRKVQKDFKHLPLRAGRSVINISQAQHTFNEYSLLQETVVRRQALRFQGVSTRFAEISAWLLSIIKFLLFSSEFILLITFYRQRYPSASVDQILGNQIVTIMNTIPFFSSGIWILTLISIFLLYRKIHDAQKYFQQEEIRRPNISVSA